MRWLLLKDLRILGRSPLLVMLLVIYPVAIALLIGSALSRGPEKPKVAFLNLVPPSENTFDLGSEKIDVSKYSKMFFTAVEPIRVQTRAQALEKVRSGEALAALIIPADITDKLADWVGTIMKSDAAREYYTRSGAVAFPGNSESMARFLRSEVERLPRLVRAAGIQPE